MGYLKIDKVIYYGEEYHYESPDFEDGINVIEGCNGSGKSTLVDLICFGLGCYVKQFNRNSKKIHREICNDKNNYVLLNITVNNEKYTLKRYINSKEDYVFVINNLEVKEFPVNRAVKEQKIFSDWLLDKLNIKQVEIYNGMYNGIISFDELFRLIHYEQKSNPSKIYKDAKVDGNFVSDSIIRKKAIFEILMGKELIDYYECLNKYKVNKKKFGSDKGVYDTFINSLKELYNVNIIDEGDKKEEIDKVDNDICKIKDEMVAISEVEYTNDIFLKELSHLKDSIINVEFILEKNKKYYKKIIDELEKVNILIQDKEIEIKQLEKIVVSHQELNIFSPTTCPYCFNEVKREKGHCVCGNEINEEYFERSFYSMEEYVLMLKQKIKGLETLKLAREDILEEIQKYTKKISEVSKKLKDKKNEILQIKNDNKLNYNTLGIKRLNDKLYELTAKRNSLMEINQLYVKGIKLKSNMDKAEEEYNQSSKNLNKVKKIYKKNIINMINDFSEIFKKLMVESVEKCDEACIDEDYMPIVNNGVYINASVDVQIKLVYFISLLWQSVVNENVNFPRLLIVDTPESLGIDKTNLVETLKMITQIPNKRKYQVILTTGLNKYPKTNEFKVKESMTHEGELLKKRTY